MSWMQLGSRAFAASSNRRQKPTDTFDGVVRRGPSVETNEMAETLLATNKSKVPLLDHTPNPRILITSPDMEGMDNVSSTSNRDYPFVQSNVKLSLDVVTMGPESSTENMSGLFAQKFLKHLSEDMNDEGPAHVMDLHKKHLLLARRCSCRKISHHLRSTKKPYISEVFRRGFPIFYDSTLGTSSDGQYVPCKLCKRDEKKIKCGVDLPMLKAMRKRLFESYQAFKLSQLMTSQSDSIIYTGRSMENAYTIKRSNCKDILDELKPILKDAVCEVQHHTSDPRERLKDSEIPLNLPDIPEPLLTARIRSQNEMVFARHMNYMTCAEGENPTEMPQLQPNADFPGLSKSTCDLYMDSLYNELHKAKKVVDDAVRAATLLPNASSPVLPLDSSLTKCRESATEAADAPAPSSSDYYFIGLVHMLWVIACLRGVF